MEPSLVVPIDVQALYIGVGNTSNFAELAADFAALPYTDSQGVTHNSRPNIGEAATPSYFTPASQTLGVGIHLHWTLPGAFTHGRATGATPISFRQTPNRWLIVRIVTCAPSGTAPTTTQKAWIVESDCLWNPASANDPLPTNTLSRAIPLSPLPNPMQEGNQSFLTVGRAFLAANWSDNTQTATTARTALGYGEVAYATAYPHAPNVFGLYDDMADCPLPNTNVSYTVTGWFSDLMDDPIAQLPPPGGGDGDAFLALVQQDFGWTYSPESSLPTETLLSGMITAIVWDPNVDPEPPVPSQAPTVAIGNTTAEALSALIASQLDPSGTGNYENVLNALQLGLLNRLEQVDGPMQIAEAQHLAGFASAQAGTLYIVKPATPGNTNGAAPVVVGGQQLLDAAVRSGGMLPEGIGDALNTLNTTQQQADALAAKIVAYRSQTFVDWVKYMLLQWGHSAIGEMKASQAFNYLNGTTIPELNALVTQQAALQSSAGAQASTLQAVLQAEGKYLLDVVQAPRYWAPNDPVILLSGPGLSPSDPPSTQGAYDAKGNLICRLSWEVVSEMQIPAASLSVTAAQLPSLNLASGVRPFTDLQALFVESFFVDAQQAAVLAYAASSQSWQSLVAEIRTAQTAFLNGQANTNVTFVGQAPVPFAVSAWVAPWIPYLMEWEVYYYPLNPINDPQPSDTGAMPTYPPDAITANYGPDAFDVDLQPNVPLTNLPTQEIYQAFAPLASNVPINIVGQINAYLQDYPDDPNAAELQKVVADAGSFPAMAQAMGGFHQALLMRKQTLQLPVSDPLAVTASAMLNRFSNQTVPAAVGSQNDRAPLPLNSFSPIRSGIMQISQIWLIDAYGQRLAILPPNGAPALAPVRAKSLMPFDDIAPSHIGLPPRFSQNSRLLFRWLAADNDAVESNSSPATSPVCGWVLFNHIDDSLVIYDAAGNPMGSLNVVGNLWTASPGRNDPFDPTIETVFADANPHLAAFALGIYHANSANTLYLQALLEAINETLGMVDPQSGDGEALSVLIGRPLALVRSSLALDLQGMPALDQSWYAFQTAMNNTQPMDDRPCAAFDEVRVPVWLGDLANLEDGLIGYFVEDGVENPYATFYAPAAEEDANGVAPPARDRLSVSASAPAPISLSMLMDPRASVHATTGFLPAKAITIPPAMYADALNRMSVTFLTTPVLTATSKFTAPIPDEAGYTWSWLSMDPTRTSWSEGPIAAIDPGNADFAPQTVREGWLKLSKRGDNNR